MELASIPPEIWHEIFTFIEPYDLLMLRMTSRFFADLIKPREFGNSQHPRKRNHYLGCGGWNFLSMIVSAIFDDNIRVAGIIMDLVTHASKDYLRDMMDRPMFISKVYELYLQARIGDTHTIQIIKLPIVQDSDLRDMRLFDDLEKGKDCYISTNNLSLGELISIGLYLIKTGNKQISRICPDWDIKGIDSFINFGWGHYSDRIRTKMIIESIHDQPGCSIIIDHLIKKEFITLPFYSYACIEYMRISQPPEKDDEVMPSDLFLTASDREFIDELH